MHTKKKSFSHKGESLVKTALVYTVDDKECPFREFRDNELGVDYWGMGPAAFRAAVLLSKAAPKLNSEFTWADEQTQPLPRSVRQYLHGWVRAEQLAFERYNSAEVNVFEENDNNKMEMASMQLGHAQVLRRSSFCRLVMSTCYMLERAEGLMVEHQWENFSFAFSEGWLARYHIYAPGMKPGGGTQHRPYLSKNGCYLVRLYYLGAWRCVWVNDAVPIDASGAPLLPFSPLITPVNKHSVAGAKPVPTVTVVSRSVQLWPLLICKALLKLLAPDMGDDFYDENAEDEELLDFDIIHSLTGGLTIRATYAVHDDLWNVLLREVPVFTWDDDDETQASTVKSKSTKKLTTKDIVAPRRSSLTTIQIKDTADIASYILPGIAPAYRMQLLVTLVRNLPIKKPLPEPEVPLWKTYRWVDWARKHGLYEAYYCPRTKFLKVSGLLKLSHSPHLLDVASTESLTAAFRDEQDKVNLKKGRDKEKEKDKAEQEKMPVQLRQLKEELREWVLFDSIKDLVNMVDVTYYPSMYQFTTTTSHPLLRNTKSLPNRALDVPAPKGEPLYLQIDNYESNVLRISLQILNPRVLFNCGATVTEFYEHSYLVLEKFEWFVDCEIAVAKAHIETTGYDSLEITFEPGRHFCRLWIHSRVTWHIAVLSESSLLLGTRDLIMAASVKECPWASRFLNNLGLCFNNWIRSSRSGTNLHAHRYDRDFFKAYQPDLIWDPADVGYDQKLLHWMFRRALESVLVRKLSVLDLRPVCIVLRKFFCDPDFGFPPKPPLSRPLREIIGLDPCDCKVPAHEGEELEMEHEESDRELPMDDYKSLVSSELMLKLLNEPNSHHPSYICDHATAEVPCGILKEEREAYVLQNEAATIIQSYWRGTWARKCLKNTVILSPDVVKSLNENVFGNLEALSSLMVEFFRMYPGAKHAYSVSTALSGMNGIRQYIGNAPLTAKCKWIPFFQGVFHCHAPVKVHLDVQCSLLQAQSTVNIYNNDTQSQLPQAHNAHITFDISPNTLGYTVVGHGSLTIPLAAYSDIHWQLTVLTSIDKVFHVCDGETEPCKEITLPSASKLHIDEIYLPNRRKIVGGIFISVFKEESINFRVAASDPNLEMEAVLKTTDQLGETIECGRCSGKGELYWPFIQVAPQSTASTTVKPRSISQNNLNTETVKDYGTSTRSLKIPKKVLPASAKRSQSKVIPISSGHHISKVHFGGDEEISDHHSGSPSSKNVFLKDGKSGVVDNPVKYYYIEVTAPNGWPLNLAQWIRVKEIINSPDFAKTETLPKKPVKEKMTAGNKEKEKDSKSINSMQPLIQIGDAYVELECSTANNGGVIVTRNDKRDLDFIAEKKSWESKEAGRHAKCFHIRKDFRTEFLEVVAAQAVVEECVVEEMNVEAYEEGLESQKEESLSQKQGPTPISETGSVELSVESEEESLFLTMPEVLKDNFVPLTFVPLCTLPKDEETIVLTPELKTQFDIDEQKEIEDGTERMKALQIYNEQSVLGRQKMRTERIETLYKDSTWDPDVTLALEERDDAIMQENLRNQLSAIKKKPEVKKK